MKSEKIKEYYNHDDFLWQSLDGELQQRYQRAIEDGLKELGFSNSIPCDQAVDIGCGGGRYTQLLPDYFTSVTGVDYTQKFVEAGNHSFGDKITFIEGDATNLPLDNNYTDFVLSIGLLECLTEPQVRQFISETFRILKPGGRFMIRFCRHGGITHFMSKIGRGPAAAYPDFYFQQPDQLCDICHQTGFSDTVLRGGLLIARWYRIAKIPWWPTVIKNYIMRTETHKRAKWFYYDTLFICGKKTEQ